MFTIGKSKRNVKIYLDKITEFIQVTLNQCGFLSDNNASKSSDNYPNQKPKNVGIQVMSTEIECNTPGCVPIEVLVIIFGAKEGSRWTGNYKLCTQFIYSLLIKLNNV